LQALDLASMGLTLVVAGSFLLFWRLTGIRQHAFVGLGMLLVGVGLSAVSTSHFELSPEGDWADALRIAGHTGGALVLLFTYIGAQGGREPSVWQVLSGASAVGAVAVVFLYFVVPPSADLPSLLDAIVYAHALQAVAWLSCAWFAAAPLRRQLRADHALVPLAFTVWGLSRVVWLRIDVTGDDGLLPAIYALRFAALAMLIGALALPRVRLATGAAQGRSRTP
jgi:hypothetical protein